jgi:hypothetical protein
VNQFRAAGVQASAHYVVSRTGHVTQMVPDRSIAWHAGNRFYNRISIGIEHAGYVGVPHSITEPEYRASERLVAHLAETYRIPLDRHHVIGHSEVPDPGNPRMHGGFDHHRDPGRYWKWREYMRAARLVARERSQPRPVTPPAGNDPSQADVLARQPGLPGSARTAPSAQVPQAPPARLPLKHGGRPMPKPAPGAPASQLSQTSPVRVPAARGGANVHPRLLHPGP